MNCIDSALIDVGVRRAPNSVSAWRKVCDSTFHRRAVATSLRPTASSVNHPPASAWTGVQRTNRKSEVIDRTDTSIAALPSVVTR